MRTRLSIFGLVAVAISLLLVPIANAARPGFAAEVSSESECCSMQESGDVSACCQTAHHNACDNKSSHSSSEAPCQQDCEECPCCAPASAQTFAVVGTIYSLADFVTIQWMTGGDDLQASRSDEPLLPPPRC